MLRVLLLFCYVYQSQGQGVKLQGKVDIDQSMASIFHEFISQYLNNDSKNVKSDININKLVDSFQKFANGPSKEISNMDGSENDNKHAKMVDINLNIDGDDRPSKKVKQSKKSNVNNDEVRATKHTSLNLSKSKRNRENRKSTRAITDDNYEEKRDRKRKTKNKHITKKEGKKVKNKDANKKMIDKKAGNKDTRKENEEKGTVNKDAGKEKEKNKYADKKVTREKTILEEIIGMEQNMHVYGRHKGIKYNVPLNNIKV